MNNNWISVSEALPKEHALYIVTTIEGKVKTAHFYPHEKEGIPGSWGTTMNGKVKAWMPMPESYYQEDNELLNIIIKKHDEYLEAIKAGKKEPGDVYRSYSAALAYLRKLKEEMKLRAYEPEERKKV